MIETVTHEAVTFTHEVSQSSTRALKALLADGLPVQVESSAVAWVEDNFDYTLTWYQKVALAAFEMDVAFAQTLPPFSGKTFVAAAAAAWWMDTHENGAVEIIAPTYAQRSLVLLEADRKFGCTSFARGTCGDYRVIVDEAGGFSNLDAPEGPALLLGSWSPEDCALNRAKAEGYVTHSVGYRQTPEFSKEPATGIFLDAHQIAHVAQDWGVDSDRYKRYTNE